MVNAQKIKETHSCYNCSNCLPIGEGDHFCDEYQKLVIEDYGPSDDYQENCKMWRK